MMDHRRGPVTPRLILRAMVPNDAPCFFALNSDPAVMRFTGEPPIGSIDEARRAIEQYPDFDPARGGVGFGRWACVLRESGAFIGFCGLKSLDDLGVVDVGFRLLPQFWGRGLATEACAASLAYGFKTLGLTRIVALVLPNNAASIRVLEKCSMRHNGTIAYEGQTALLYESP